MPSATGILLTITGTIPRGTLNQCQEIPTQPGKGLIESGLDVRITNSVSISALTKLPIARALHGTTTVRAIGNHPKSLLGNGASR